MSCMNKQSDAGMRAVLTLRMDLRCFSSALCALFFSSVRTRAERFPATPPSQLARENPSRVTTSAGDIKAVLERPQVRELGEKARREIEQCQANLTAFSANPALGRVVTPISPHMNSWENSAQDIELEARDRLTISKRPGYLTVTSQVYTPTAASSRPGRRTGAQRSHFDEFLAAGGESHEARRHRIDR